MKRNSLLHRTGLLALAMIALPALLTAQVSLYGFTESVGTYTPITDADGGVTLGVPAYWPHVLNNRAWVNNPYNDPDGQVTMSGYLNPASGPGYPIGFDFTFNGDVYDVIGISNGGWISFGKSSDGLNAVWVYNWSGTQQGDPLIQWYNGPTPNYKRNRVAGFGNSALQQVDWTSLVPPGQLSKLRVATIGTAPNRVCVVQWEDYGLRGDVTVAMNIINFQIRLYEADNSVEVVFGPMDWVSSLGRYKRTQCGLGGRTNEDFNGRKTVYEEPAFLYDWNQTVPMDTVTDFCQFQHPEPFQPNGSGIPPVEGLTWRWTVPVCPPPTWPQEVSDVSFESALVSWQPTAAGLYEYMVSTEANPDGPVVTGDVTSDLEAFLFGLDPMTEYYFFIRSICDGEPGAWSMPTPFRTIGGGMVECDGTAIDVYYCSHQHDSITWKYISTDGSPLKLELYNGYRSQVTGESFRVWDGEPSPSNQPIYTLPMFGNPAGVNLTSGSGYFTIVLVTLNGSCEGSDWFLPFEWRVGCSNCQDPLASYSVESDCDNDQYFVKVNIFSLGSSPTVEIGNSAGVDPILVSTTGEHTVGPFPAGLPVTISVLNTDNVMCHSESSMLINTPCLEEVCGPTDFTQCYGYNEFHQWGYACDCNGEEVGIRFISGTVGYANTGYWYNAANPDDAAPQALGASGFWGGLANQLITSGPPSTDHALVLEVQTSTEQCCTDPNGTYGASEEWHYVVGCYDGCTQPKANFTTSCVSNTQFEVEVTITDIGSTASVEITNNGGAAAITASTTGTYVVGPFPVGAPVTVEVEGANILCTWTSAPLVKNSSDCLGTGIPDEGATQALHIYPNPGNGYFHLELPAPMNGTNHLRVFDITGRTVAEHWLEGTGLHQVDLRQLPSGLYSMSVENNNTTLNGKINIQH